MTNRFDKVSRFVSAVGIGIGVVAAQRVNEWLGTHHVSDAMLIVVAFAIIVLAGEMLTTLFDHSLLNWPAVRRLVLGRYYVEGTWLDVMRKDGNLLAIGITRIQPDGQGVQISGEDCDPAYAFTGRYTTMLYGEDWPTIRYVYHYDRSDDAVVSQGLVEMQFDPRAGGPVRYTGSYLDPVDGRRVSFEGWKVTDATVLNRLDDRDQRSNVIREFCVGGACQL